MERNRRRQIDKSLESSEINKYIKIENETESCDWDEDETPLDFDFLKVGGNCKQEQDQDPLQPQPGQSSMSPGISKKTKTRQNSGKGTGTRVEIQDQATFKNKIDFTVEMQKEVSLVVEECVRVLKNDPREYHPFYLTVHKWIGIGIEQAHISEKKVNLIWEKCNDLAVAQFEKNKDNPKNTPRKDKPQSEDLQYFLAQMKRKSSQVSRGVRIVEREWKREINDKQPTLKDIRTNLQARLKFFQFAKSATSLEDCFHMNSLWSRLLSSNLLQQKEAPTPSSSLPERVLHNKKRQKVEESGKVRENRLKRKKEIKGLASDETKVKGRARKNQMARENMAKKTPEEREKFLKRRSELRRLRISRASEEGKLAEKDRNTKQMRLKRAKLFEEMSEEEKQAVRDKRAQQMRLSRAKRFEKMTEEEKQAVKDKRAEEMRLSRAKLFEKMTEEEKQAVRDKRAEDMRLRRVKRFEKMTEEEKQVILDKEAVERRRNQDKLRLQKAKADRDVLVETEEEKENLRQIKELEKRLKLDDVSLEEKVEIRMKITELRKPRLEKVKALRKQFLEGLSEEERFQVRMDTYLKRQASQARNGRQCRSSMPPDWKEYQRLRRKKYMESLPPEMKQRISESTKNSVRRRFQKLKKDPTKLAEVYRNMNEVQKKKRETETVEQAQKRQKRVNEYQRQRTKKETEEQRWKRLTRYKVYQSRIKLRKEMEEEENFTEEEFERRLEEIVKQIMSQNLPPSDFKPRTDTKKEVSGGSILIGGLERYITSAPVTNEPMLKMELPVSTGENLSFEPVSSSAVNPASHLFDCEDLSELEPEHEVEDSLWSPESSMMPTEIENEEVPALILNETRFQPDVNVKLEGAGVEVALNEKLVGEGNLAESSLGSLIKCKHCVEQFSLEEELRAHIHSKHPGKCWTCPMCKMVILSPAELVEHFKAEHNEEREARPRNQNSEKIVVGKNVNKPAPAILSNSKVGKSSVGRKN